MANISLKSLLIEGFGPYREPQSIFFGDTGFNYIVGKNGAGKSYIFNSLIWVLYGKTSRNTKASVTGNWVGDHKCQGQVEFVIDKKEHYVYRSWNPNELILDDEIVTQDRIDKLLGVGFDGFLRAVILCQTGDSFFDLKPSEKLSIFSDILNLDFWVQCSKKASEKLKESQGKLLEIKSQLESNKGSLFSWNTVLDQSVKEFTDFEKKKSIELVRLDKELSEAKESEKQLQNEVVKKQTLISQQKQLYDDYTNKKSLLEKEIRTVNSKISSYNNQHELLSSKRDYEIQELNKLRNKTCPTCGQAIHDDKDLTEKCQNKENKINQYQEELNKNKKENQEFFNSVTEYQNKLDEMVKNVCNSPDMQPLLIARENLSRKQSDIMKISHDIEQYIKPNPYQNRINEAKNQIRGLEGKESTLTVAMDVQNQAIKNLELWENYFKELRLWIIQTALLEYQICINDILPQLGLSKWKVELEIERETKSGTISKEFSILITPPNQKEAKAWESYSGGESQRLRIAGAIGLMELIRSRTGSRFSLEIYDEATHHLTDQGIQELLEILKERSEKKQIFFVDHHTVESGVFDQVYEIVPPTIESGSIIKKL